MKARQSVLLVAALLCSVAPVCAMDEVVSDESVNAVDVVMPQIHEDMDMAGAEECVMPQHSQDKLVKKPFFTEDSKADIVMGEVVSPAVSMEEEVVSPVGVAMEEEMVTPAGVAVEAEEVSADKNADVRGVFEEMSREEAGDQVDEAEHIG